MGKCIVVINGHPGRDRLGTALAEAYAAGAAEKGASVTRFDLAALNFDPILHEGYEEIQELEPDIAVAQNAVTEADHVAFVYPTWWGGPPALLKGFIERVFLPGVMFSYKGGDSLMWDRHMKGTSARCITTMDAPGIFYRLFTGAPGDKMMKRSILGFCGVKPVRFTRYTRIKLKGRGLIDAHVEHARRTGQKDAG